MNPTPSGTERLLASMLSVALVAAACSLPGEASPDPSQPPTTGAAVEPDQTTLPEGSPGTPEVEPTVAPSVDSTVATGLSTASMGLLDGAVAITWEDWELVEGVTSQVLYQFPSKGGRVAFVDQVREDVAAQGVATSNSQLSALRFDLIEWGDERYSGVGYFGTLVVLVEAASVQSIVDAMSIIDNEWCCGTSP